ncbi:MAG: glycoside hydrolase [Abditibacteriota bacterium]|nr:glycoside hydrolase [Abditibacteriota bacterium]
MLDITNPLLKNAPFWSWNDNMTKEECKRQIEEMHKAGWGSFFMHARLGIITPYLQDEWMELCRFCAEEAGKLGMKAWLYDEDKWPSGYAGGLVSLKEENRLKELVLLKKDEIKDYDTVLAEFPYKGNVHYICRRLTPLTNGGWFNGYAYVDLMNPQTVRDFLLSTHEKYKEALGDFFGKEIPGIFTDEPCYSFRVDGVTKVQWSDLLPETFKKKTGYDIMDNLHKLFFDIDDFTKVRFDFYNVTTEMFREAFTHQYFDWCNKNNLILTGHFMCEDYLWFQTEWSGDVMSHYEYMTWPGVDKLYTHLKQNVTFKQVSSASEQLGKERTFAEIFALMGNHTSFLERKWVGDWQSILGSNFINSHLSLYSMRGERKRDCPANYYYQQPWWDQEKNLGDYFARTCAFGTEGKREIDLLVFQPLTSVWCEHSPLEGKFGYGVSQKYDKPFEDLAKRFMEEKLDYHFGNEYLMNKYAHVEGKNLVVGKCSYSVVYIPPCSNMNKSTYKLLQEFSHNGGKLIFTEALPYLLEGEPCNLSFENYEIVKDVEDAIVTLKKYIKTDIEIKDLWGGNDALDIWCERRVVGDSVRYFLANTRRDKITKTKIILSDKPALYDLHSGELYSSDVYCKKTDKGYEININFTEAGSVLIITGEEAKGCAKMCPASFGSGVNFEDFNKPILTINDFKTELMSENLLVLNDVKLKIGGKIDEGSVHHVCFRSFANAPEGTDFEMWYTFESMAEIEGAFMGLECAENLDLILFNDEKLSAPKVRGELGVLKDDKAWLDPNITKIYLPKIKVGVNTLYLKGKKMTYINDFPIVYKHHDDYCPTDCEDVYILGDFSLERAGDGKFVITEKKPIKDAYNITAQGAPFYIGKVKAVSSFNVDKENKKYYLKLINARKSSCEVFVNGQSCGQSVIKNDVFDITDAVKDGENKLEIVFATTLYNAFGPNKNPKSRGESVDGAFFVLPERCEDRYDFEEYGIEAVCIY